MKLRFLFVGGRHDWRPLDGHRAPEWTPFQMRSLPGNVVATAKTEREAVLLLQQRLERCFERAGSPEAWYKQAVSDMSPEDVQDMATLLRNWFESGRDMQRADGIEFAQVDEAERGAAEGACA